MVGVIIVSMLSSFKRQFDECEGGKHDGVHHHNLGLLFSSGACGFLSHTSATAQRGLLTYISGNRLMLDGG